ncbi:hypothetical protein GCM10023259_028100 [Thermocatellispora tengchongensis]
MLALPAANARHIPDRRQLNPIHGMCNMAPRSASTDTMPSHCRNSRDGRHLCPLTAYEQRVWLSRSPTHRSGRTRPARPPAIRGTVNHVQMDRPSDRTKEDPCSGLRSSGW